MRVVEGRLAVDDPDALVDRIDAVGSANDCAIQAFDATMITGRGHLTAAVDHANRAVDRGEAVARERAVEILLYAAGRRQIRQALAIGVDVGTVPAVLVVDADARVGRDTSAPADDPDAVERAAAETIRERLDLEPAAVIGDTDERAVREFFEIGDAELAATTAGLAALVRERVALLDVEK